MKAMIFAAGLGTRLQPLTNDTPKALVKINGRSLLEICIEQLAENGFDEIIINVHHLADQIINFIKEYKSDIKISISDEREKLLDTGGGLKKAAWFFDDKPFLIHNVDIISDLNLKDLYSQHISNQSLATLAVRNRTSSRYFLFNDQMTLCGWENVKTSEKIFSRKGTNLTQFAFSGIHIVDPRLFDHFPEEDKFSIVDAYLKTAEKEEIKGYLHNSTFWKDLGKIEDLKNISKT